MFILRTRATPGANWQEQGHTKDMDRIPYLREYGAFLVAQGFHTFQIIQRVGK